MIKMSGYPAEYWEKNRCQSIHITVGYHRFPPTQHILKHNWINESKMRKRPQEATATPHIFFFFPPSFLTPRRKTFFWCLHQSIMARKFRTKECPAGHQPRLPSAQSAEGGKDIFSLQRSPPPSLLICPASCVCDPPGSPFHHPHLNFLVSQVVVPALNNICTVPPIRQCYFSFWFILIFAIFSLQQITVSIMVGWSQSPYRNLD